MSRTVSAIALLSCLVFASCAATPPEQRSCSQLVSSMTEAQQAVSASNAAGRVVCLRDGQYGGVTLNGNGTSSADVVLQPEHRQGVTINGGVTMTGHGLTLSGFYVNGQVTMKAGGDHLSVTYNRITGGYFGVVAGDSTNVWATNMFVYGNRFVGPFGEDGIRANRYDGLLIRGNEFTNIRENGEHSDCFQSVYGGRNLTFSQNYLHDNRCQGFFIKDQASNCNTFCTVQNVHVTDNLFARNDASCVGVSCGGGPADVDLFGPNSDVTVEHNTTVADTIGNQVLAIQDPGWLRLTVKDNVLGRLYASGTDAFSSTYSTNANNVYCDSGNWPASAVSGWAHNCAPSYRNAGADDYRLTVGDAGITWTPTSPPTTAGRYGP